MVCTRVFLVACLAACPLAAEEAQPDIAKISEAFGHLIGKNIQNLGIDFSMNDVIKGLQDATAGKEPPLSEKECVEAISAAQEAAFQAQSQDNLKKADAFMAANGKEPGVTVLEEGKLHYKVEQPGVGQEVQPHFSPLVRYTGRFADGTIFGASREDELISLDETIPGFSKGIVGMKEGEKRLLYIHPDLAYGTTGMLPPNSLITFEIEVIKAQADQQDVLSSSDHEKGTSELASPLQEGEAIR
jgi:peptidylprolyl isomerase